MNTLYGFSVSVTERERVGGGKNVDRVGEDGFLYCYASRGHSLFNSSLKLHRVA